MTTKNGKTNETEMGIYVFGGFDEIMAIYHKWADRLFNYYECGTIDFTLSVYIGNDEDCAWLHFFANDESLQFSDDNDLRADCERLVVHYVTTNRHKYKSGVDFTIHLGFPSIGKRAKDILYQATCEDFEGLPLMGDWVSRLETLGFYKFMIAYDKERFGFIKIREVMSRFHMPESSEMDSFELEL